MAFAKKIEKEIEIVRKEKVNIISLELTTDEAESIRAVAQRVAGNPENSRRKHFDDIDDALRHTGINLQDYDHYVDEDPYFISGHIEFKENESNG